MIEIIQTGVNRYSAKINGVEVGNSLCAVDVSIEADALPEVTLTCRDAPVDQMTAKFDDAHITFVFEHDGCVGCKYEEVSDNCWPCCDCKQSYRDMWRSKNEE